MEKRGQVTVFAILGILILLLAGLFLYLRQTRGVLVSAPVFLTSQLKPIQENIQECTQKAVGPGVTLLGKQGGTFSPANYRFYQGQYVRYFCQNIPGKDQCLNTIPSLTSITEELKHYLSLQIDTCVDKTLIDDATGVTVEGTRALSVDTKLEQGIIIVTTTYDVTLSKDGSSVHLSPVIQNFEAPIEELYDVSRDIVQAHAQTGQFDQLIYMLHKKGLYEINVDKPFPDTIYKINKKDSSYQFWFAVEGESQ